MGLLSTKKSQLLIPEMDPDKLFHFYNEPAIINGKRYLQFYRNRYAVIQLFEKDIDFFIAVCDANGFSGVKFDLDDYLVFMLDRDYDFKGFEILGGQYNYFETSNKIHIKNLSLAGGLSIDKIQGKIHFINFHNLSCYSYVLSMRIESCDCLPFDSKSDFGQIHALYFKNDSKYLMELLEKEGLDAWMNHVGLTKIQNHINVLYIEHYLYNTRAFERLDDGAWHQIDSVSGWFEGYIPPLEGLHVKVFTGRS